MLKICPTCNREFKAKGTKPTYCSKKCYSMKGELNPKWNGGISHSGGYKYLYKPSHPHATKLGYVLEHRLVMEQKIGRLLNKNEIIHHMNHDPSDNRPENLMIYHSPGRHFVSEHLDKRASNGRFVVSDFIQTSKPKHLSDIEWLKTQYIDNNKTAQEIADELGCTRASITATLARYGIKKRR